MITMSTRRKPVSWLCCVACAVSAAAVEAALVEAALGEASIAAAQDGGAPTRPDDPGNEAPNDAVDSAADDTGSSEEGDAVEDEATEADLQGEAATLKEELDAPETDAGTGVLDARETAEAESVAVHADKRACSVDHPNKEADWLRFSSDEWVQGQLKRIRDDVVEFDSNQLGIIEFDLADVAEFCSIKHYTYVMDDNTAIDGVAHIDEKTVVVLGGEERTNLQFSRERLMSVVSGPPKESSYWSARFNFGVSLSRGNADQVTTNSSVRVEREDAWTRLRLAYDNTFAVANGDQSANSHFGELKQDVFLTKIIYVTPAFGSALNDSFQNIKVRVNVGSGLGSHLVDRDKVWWDLEAGVGYQYLNLDVPDVGQEDPLHNGVARLATAFGFELGEVCDLDFSWETFLAFTDLGRTSHRGVAEFSNDLWDDYLDLNVKFIYERTEDPLGSDPDNIPVKNDYQLVVGLAADVG